MDRTYTLVYVVDTSQALPGLDAVKHKIGEVRTEAQQLAAALNTSTTSLVNLQGAAAATAPAVTQVGDAAKKTGSHLAEMRTEAIAFTAGAMAFGAVVNVLTQMGEKANEVRQKMREMADDAAMIRNEYRELANLKGHSGPDDEITMGGVEFGMKAGMTPSEARVFLEQYEGSAPAGRQKHNIGGGIRKGETEEQYAARVAPIEQEIALEGARFGQRVGLGTKTAGDISGAMSQYGKIGGKEDAARMWGRIAYGLNEGRGNIEPLAVSLANTAGAVVEENGGAVGSLDELGVMLGVMSTHAKPERAGTYLRKSISALRDFGGKQGDALKSMDITGSDSHLEALQKLAKRVHDDEQKGMTSDLSLQNMHFNDRVEREALMMEVKDLPMMEARLKKMDTISGKEVMAKNEAFFTKDLAGQGKMLNAKDQAGKYVKGREMEELQLARRAAVIRMRDNGTLNSEEQQYADKISDAGGILPALGVPESFQQRIDEEAHRALVASAREAGYVNAADNLDNQVNKLGTMEQGKAIEMRARAFRNLAPKIKKKGGDWTGGTGALANKVHAAARPEKKQAEIDSYRKPILERAANRPMMLDEDGNSVPEPKEPGPDPNSLEERAIKGLISFTGGIEWMLDKVTGGYYSKTGEWMDDATDAVIEKGVRRPPTPTLPKPIPRGPARGPGVEGLGDGKGEGWSMNGDPKTHDLLAQVVTAIQKQTGELRDAAKSAGNPFTGDTPSAGGSFGPYRA